MEHLYGTTNPQAHMQHPVIAKVDFALPSQPYAQRGAGMEQNKLAPKPCPPCRNWGFGGISRLPGANGALAHPHTRVCASRRKHALAVGRRPNSCHSGLGSLSHPAARQRRGWSGDRRRFHNGRRETDHNSYDPSTLVVTLLGYMQRVNLTRSARLGATRWFFETRPLDGWLPDSAHPHS